MTKVYDRSRSQYYEEIQYGQKALNFLYNNLLGRLFLGLATSKALSRFVMRRKESKRSVKDIAPFVKKYGINMDDFEAVEYQSFNDFFTRKARKGRRQIAAGKNGIIAVDDSKLCVYPIGKDLRMIIKQSRYDLEELLRDKDLAERFDGGVCFVYRLSVDDYHRYCFAASGGVTHTRKIKGVLHTVSSISQRYKVFAENSREYCLIETKNTGSIIQMEVGAILVGRIINHDIKEAVCGEEKGYFAYGGSTIIVIYEKDRVIPDEDLLRNSQDGIETRVKLGERVGKVKF